MKTLTLLSKKIEKQINNTIPKLVKVQQGTAKNICNDAKQIMSSHGTGKYADSIIVGNTKVEDKKITTVIGSNMTVIAKSNGNKYNLGRLLETGTTYHAIPNAFGFGETYAYVDEQGKWHKGTMDDDWHPGFNSILHYYPAYLKNEIEYKKNIQKVLNGKR